MVNKATGCAPKQIALGLRRVRSVAERCFKIVDKQIRLNSKVIIVAVQMEKVQYVRF